jgi:hypothetical protein
MKHISELKAYLKAQAATIKETRTNFKNAQRKHSAGETGNPWQLRVSLNSLQWEYRHHHIAYCELRGRSRDEIESPKENNEPNEDLIQKIKNTYYVKAVADETEQTIHFG